MKGVYIFLAEGFEDVEALATADVLRRGGVGVELVSITDDPFVVSSHRVAVGVDQSFDFFALNIDRGGTDERDVMIFPGGMPGTMNLASCDMLMEMMQEHYDDGGTVAAICAAPLVFGHLGLLEGRRATCYPGFESELKGATYTAALVERDGDIITGKGPGAAFEFGYAITDFFLGEGASMPLKQGMIYSELRTKSEE